MSWPCIIQGQDLQLDEAFMCLWSYQRVVLQIHIIIRQRWMHRRASKFPKEGGRRQSQLHVCKMDANTDYRHQSAVT